MLQAQNSHAGSTNCLIAVGANKPTRGASVAETVQIALRMLDDGAGALRRQSRLFRTPAFPAESGPDFINAVVEIKTRLSAHELLRFLHETETRLGRTRTNRWEARVLDLDLLSFGDAVLPDPRTYEHWRRLPPAQQATIAPDQLIVPHPRMHERGFVLAPLADFFPDWRHPVLNRSAAEMLAALPPDALEGIVPV